VIDNQHIYDSLSVADLTNLLIDPEQRLEVHRAVLSSISRLISSSVRTAQLLKALREMASKPQRYNQEVMMGVVDILATDPNPEATSAMLQVLPAMLGLGGSEDLVDDELRQYFCEALMTRRREDDLAVWHEVVPKLSGAVWVAILTDPAASALKPLKPLKMIERLPEPRRRKALQMLFSRALGDGNLKLAWTAAKMLLFGSRSSTQ